MEPLSSAGAKYGVQPGKEGVVKGGIYGGETKSSNVFCRRSEPSSRDVAAWLVRPLQWNATTNMSPHLSGGNGCEGWVTWAPGIEGCGRGRTTGVLQKGNPGSKVADLH